MTVPIVYVTLMVCGLPASSPLAQVALLTHARTVILLVNVPAPRMAGEAGVTVACPLFPLSVKFETLLTAGPTGVTTMYSVPLKEPVTVPVTFWLAGLTVAGLAAEKLSTVGLSEKVAEPDPPPPLELLLEELRLLELLLLELLELPLLELLLLELLELLLPLPPPQPAI